MNLSHNVSNFCITLILVNLTNPIVFITTILLYKKSTCLMCMSDMFDELSNFHLSDNIRECILEYMKGTARTV